MKLTNTISGDTYQIRSVTVKERESDETVTLDGVELDSDEWVVQ